MRSGNLNLGSPNVSQRRSSTKNQTHGSSLCQNNSHLGNSGDEGDENPSKENIGKTHTALVVVKRKRNVTQNGENKIPTPKHGDMETYAYEEESDWSTQTLLENREITQELACQEPLIFEE